MKHQKVPGGLYKYIFQVYPCRRLVVIAFTLFFELEWKKKYTYINGASLVAQMVKNLPAVWETQVGSLGQEDPLEEGMATQSSILPWRIPWTQEPGGLQSMGSQRVRHD